MPSGDARMTALGVNVLKDRYMGGTETRSRTPFEERKRKLCFVTRD